MAIKERKPKNIPQLANLIHRDYANVWRDCWVLANCGIIKLVKKEQEYQPIILYKQIILDFPSKATSVRSKLEI